MFCVSESIYLKDYVSPIGYTTEVHRVVQRVLYSVPQSKASAWILTMAQMMLGQWLMIVVYWRTELTSCIARRLRPRNQVREGMSSCNRTSMMSSTGSLSSCTSSNVLSRISCARHPRRSRLFFSIVKQL